MIVYDIVYFLRFVISNGRRRNDTGTRIWVGIRCARVFQYPRIYRRPIISGDDYCHPSQRTLNSRYIYTSTFDITLQYTYALWRYYISYFLVCPPRLLQIDISTGERMEAERRLDRAIEIERESERDCETEWRRGSTSWFGDVCYPYGHRGCRLWYGECARGMPPSCDWRRWWRHLLRDNPFIISLLCRDDDIIFIMLYIVLVLTYNRDRNLSPVGVQSFRFEYSALNIILVLIWVR